MREKFIIESAGWGIGRGMNVRCVSCAYVKMSTTKLIVKKSEHYDYKKRGGFKAAHR